MAGTAIFTLSSAVEHSLERGPAAMRVRSRPQPVHASGEPSKVEVSDARSFPCGSQTHVKLDSVTVAPCRHVEPLKTLVISI